jgi:hypothetical protein
MGNPLSDRSDSQFQSIPVISSESEPTRQQFGLSNVAWLPKRPGWAWSTCGQSNSAVQSGQPYSKIEEQPLDVFPFRFGCLNPFGGVNQNWKHALETNWDHWSDPSGTESNNVQLNQIIDVR